MDNFIDTKHVRTALAAVAIMSALLGLCLSSASAAWIAGNLGISAAAASQLVDAIDKGGLALAAVLAALGGGIGGAAIATIKSVAKRLGKNAAVA